MIPKPPRSRILLIGHTASLGGAELALLRLVQHLDKVRFEPVVLLFSDGPLITKLRELSVEVHCLPLAADVNQASRTHIRLSALLRGREMVLVARQILAVAQFIRKNSIDLVHTNSLKAATIGGLAATFARKPLVWYVHDRIAADYLPGVAVRALHFFALTLPTFVVGNSISTLRTFLPKLPRRYGVVYPGVDTELFRKSLLENSTTPDDPRRVKVGIVGRLSPTKGQEVFIKAAALVALRHPKAKFYIIGSAMFNDGEWEATLRSLARQLPHLDLEFSGFCANIPAKMAELDVVVHASTVPEPFGQVVAEAMCCGKPVVATNAGGVPEVISDGVCGWLVSRGNAEEMADRINWLLDHPEEARAMGNRGQLKIASRFTVQNMARDMESIYEQCLAAGSSAGWLNGWRASTSCVLGGEEIASNLLI